MYLNYPNSSYWVAWVGSWSRVLFNLLIKIMIIMIMITIILSRERFLLNQIYTFTVLTDSLLIFVWFFIITQYIWYKYYRTRHKPTQTLVKPDKIWRMCTIWASPFILKPEKSNTKCLLDTVRETIFINSCYIHISIISIFQISPWKSVA